MGCVWYEAIMSLVYFIIHNIIQLHFLIVLLDNRLQGKGWCKKRGGVIIH